MPDLESAVEAPVRGDSTIPSADGRPWRATALRRLLLVAPAVFALHNAEEAVGMGPWLRDQLPGLLEGVRASFPPEALTPEAAALLERLRPPTPGQFYWTLVWVTIIPAAVYWVAAARGPRSRWTTVAVWCQAVFLVNVFVPHLAGAIALRRYTPGVVTAVLLNLPLSWLLLRAAVREGAVTRRALLAFGVSAVAACVLLLALTLVLMPALAGMTAG